MWLLIASVCSESAMSYLWEVQNATASVWVVPERTGNTGALVCGGFQNPSPGNQPQSTIELLILVGTDPEAFDWKWDSESLAPSQAKNHVLERGWDGTGWVRTFPPEAGVLTPRPQVLLQWRFPRAYFCGASSVPSALPHQPGQPWKRRGQRLSGLKAPL